MATRRQALGSLAVNSNSTHALNIGNQNQLKKQQVLPPLEPFKVNLNGGLPIIDKANSENEIQKFLQITGKDNLKKQTNGEFDFEVFRDESTSVAALLKKNDSTNLLGSDNSNKENNSDCINDQLFRNEVSEEEEEEESQQEQVEDEDEGDDYDTEQEESEEDSEDESEDIEEDIDSEEEEGISRLNLASDLCDSSSSLSISIDKIDLMMDSSGSSPMVLDGTNAENVLDDEEDEETRVKIESENVLFNFIDFKDSILSYMRKLELEYRAKPDYMRKQADITSAMRTILVDWLVEVSQEYKFHEETLYIAVNFADRFLSQMSVLRTKLQLVGTASMYVASKYEEITPPDVREFVYVTDDTYSKKQILRMEHLLLKTLDFRVSQPTINWFLMHYLKFIQLNTSFNSPSNNYIYQRVHNLAKYLAELTLLDCDTFLNYLPSQIAASAIYLALISLDRQWTKQIADIVGYNYDLSELSQCIQDMYKMFKQASDLPQQSIQEKYNGAKYEHVSSIDPPKSLPSQVTSRKSHF